MNEDADIETMRREAERMGAENERIQRERGFLRGRLLPGLTHSLATIAGGFGILYFCILGTMLDRRYSHLAGPRHQIDYEYAEDNYLGGKLERAANRAAEILIKVPNHPWAQLLMAHIKEIHGDRTGAIGHLRKALETTEDPEKVTQWLARLEGK